MPRQFLWSAAAASLCVLITTNPGFTQTAHHRQLSAARSTQSQDQSRYQYQAAAPATLVGTYHSNDFFPSPLVLNISGMDRYGNLFGSISGWRTTNIAGRVDPSWETWQHVFGKDGSRAFYRDGKINIVFPNGATYTLDNGGNGNVLAGKFTANNENITMTFLKSQAFAGR